MKQKFFIIGFYSDLENSFECFRASELFFDSFQSCVNWIESHKKFFAPCVRLGIYSVDNDF